MFRLKQIANDFNQNVYAIIMKGPQENEEMDCPSPHPAYTFADLYSVYREFVLYINGPIMDSNGKKIMGSRLRIEHKSTIAFKKEFERYSLQDVLRELGTWQHTQQIQYSFRKRWQRAEHQVREWGLNPDEQLYYDWLCNFLNNPEQGDYDS